MKKVLCTAIVLIVLGTVWMLYLQRENNRFRDSLPKVPSRMNIEQPIDTITQENTTENENIGLPMAANVRQESTNETEEMSLNTAHRPPHDSNPHSHEQGPTFRIEQEPNVPDQFEKEGDLEQVEESNPPSSFMDLSLEQIIENNRQALINRHGNIPEIDIYLKLNEPFFRALLKDKPTKVVIERTPEESLESSRVTAILFPNEANKKAYQDELKKMKELGVIK